MKKSAFLLFFLLVFTAVNAQTYSFKYNWKKGQKFYFESVADQNIDMDMGVNTVQTIKTGCTIFVVDVTPKGNFVCDVTYDKMELKSSIMESLGIQEAIDKAMAQLYGLGYRVEVTQTGECVSVSGTETLVKDYAYRMYPGTTPEDKFKRDEFLYKIKAQYNDSTLKMEFENLGGGFTTPSNVKVNDTWTRTSNTKLVVKKATLNTYKLDAIDGNIATISVVSSSKTDGNFNIPNMTDTSPDLAIEGTGVYKVDLKTGLMVSGSSSMQGNGTITNMGQTVKLKIDSKSVLSQKEVKN
jgi:hypothetical protein